VESIEQQQAESLKTDGSPVVPVEGQDTKATPKANADAKKPAEKVAAPAVPTEGEEKPVVKKAAKKVAPKAEETPAETDNE
jgi:hypothetical protein